MVEQIDNLGMSSLDLTGKTVSINISNSNGVCNKCYAGLLDPSKPSGVLKQFSERYQTLTIRITAEGGNAMPGRPTVTILGGKIVD